MTALLALRGVTKQYPGVRALAGVDFDVAAGEVHALAGQNGAGKSTLMKILSGALSPDAGEIVWQGQRVRFRSPREAIAAGVRLIHQELSLVPELSVAENIFLGREPAQLGFVRRAAMEDAARAVLARLGISLDVRARVGILPMAKRQIVEIARALAGDAKLLAMDEPTSALNPEETARLHTLIRSLAAAGTGIIYISHRLEELRAIAARVTVLRDGGVVTTRPIRELPIPELVRVMVGEPAAAPAPAPAAPIPVEKRTNVRAFFEGGSVALRVEGFGAKGDLALDVARGEVVGLAGLLGAGRTELLRAVFGADRTSGRITIGGQLVRIRSPRDAIRAGIALAPEDRKGQALVLDRPVRENIALVQLRALSRAGFVHARREREVAERWTRELGIRTPSIEQPVRALSGGNQQKVVLARWLAARPQVLLLDEPTRGVDVGGKAEIYALIRSFAAEGMAILLASSELSELLELCDRIAVLREGRLSTVLPRAEATEERIVRFATGVA